MADEEAETEMPEGLDDPSDPEEVRAALGGVASGLAEQLTTITQEMNKIREELYGDNGIGGIAQELEKLKSGSLGSLQGLSGLSEGLEGLSSLSESLDSSLGGLRGSGQDGQDGQSGQSGQKHQRDQSGQSGDGSDGGLGRSGEPEAQAEGLDALRARAKARPRPIAPLDKERKLEELRRKIERRHLMDEKKGKENAGFLEWLVIIFVIFMMVYTASSSFRTQVKQFFGEMLGEVPDVETYDLGAVVQEDVDSYFWVLWILSRSERCQTFHWTWIWARNNPCKKHLRGLSSDALGQGLVGCDLNWREPE